MPCPVSPKGGRPTTAFYLTQAQALFILAKSETARANIELAYVVEHGVSRQTVMRIRDGVACHG